MFYNRLTVDDNNNFEDFFKTLILMDPKQYVINPCFSLQNKV